MHSATREGAPVFAEETADVVGGIRDTRVANCINGGSACAAREHEGRIGHARAMLLHLPRNYLRYRLINGPLCE